MGSSKTPVVGGSDKAKTGREASKRVAPTSDYRRKPQAIPKWNVTEYKPPRKISDKELEAARKMFFDLDRDGSGSIDAEELGMMLRSLGQNPTDEELHELIDSVDDGDKDGQIQLREFLKLYTAKTKGQAGKEDVNNVFTALGGDFRTPGSTVTKAALVAEMLDNYDLEIDVDAMFGKAGGELTKDDLEGFLVKKE